MTEAYRAFLRKIPTRKPRLYFPFKVTTTMFLNQKAAYTNGSKLAAALKAKEKRKIRSADLPKPNSLSRKPNVAVPTTSASLIPTKKVAGAGESNNRRGSMETMTTYSTNSSNETDVSSTPINAIELVNAPNPSSGGCDGNDSVSGSVVSVSIAADSVISVSSSNDMDLMSKEDAKKYVGKVLVKVIDIEQEIDMKLTSLQFAKAGSQGKKETTKLEKRKQVVHDAIESLELVLGDIEMSPDGDECAGVKARVKKIRSMFAGC